MVTQRILVTTVLLVSGLLSRVEAPAQASSPQRLITGPIDDSQVVRTAGNTHPLAQAQYDQGLAPSDLPMARMQLVLKRSALQEQALQKLLLDLQDKTLSSYHQWLTPEQFGAQFGPSAADVQTVVSWLESKGFQVAGVSKGRISIEFSGTAGQVAQAFGTEVHKYNVDGESHWANNSDPAIPLALMPAVEGIASLHNFLAAPQVIVSGQRFTKDASSGAISPQFTSTSGAHALSPGDYSTIYNTAPLFSSGTNGGGTTIAVIGRTNINLQDIADFRNLFGLPSNPPQIVLNGPDPGDLGGGEEIEAVLDTSWSGAVAPSANVKLVVSASTNATDGISLSELYIIDNNLAPIMTESFGSCEANFTRSQSSSINQMAEQAAAEGITYLVSSGDTGAAGCDPAGANVATHPISVNILSSSPFVVAVGGTQFNDLSNPSAYWLPTNSSSRSSARSYIPENVWNEGATSINLYAGGGGASMFFSKPSWQAGMAGIPNDGARDVPDVSLTAAGHDPYLLCFNRSCATSPFSFYGISGTSASAPAFAGIMALVNQKTGSRQGQANPVFYALAASENLSQCNGSSTASLPASTCIFNDTTVGNNAVRGESGFGTSSALYQAGVGYDLATGLGSVNAYNLVNGWSSAFPASSVSPTVHDFGLVEMNASPATFNLTYQFNTTATPQVSLKYGVDYSIVSQSCSGSGMVTCNVAVAFSPQYPGIRQDALIVTNGASSVVTVLKGLGLGPEAVLLPGIITKAAGNGAGIVNAALNAPKGLAVDAAGNVFVADSMNNVVRLLNAQTGVLATVAGNGSAGSAGDGAAATLAQLNGPTAVAVDGAGNLYIADSGNAVVRRVDGVTGVISTVAGNGTSGFSIGGGVATNASLGRPGGVAVDPSGNLFVSDDQNAVVWKVSAGTSNIAVFAGNGTHGNNGDGGPGTSAELGSPEGLGMDSDGNLYIADSTSNVIREVLASGAVIGTVAGNGTPGSAGDGNLATSAQLTGPSGVALDAAGDLYIADSGNGKVRKVSRATHVVSTIAGYQSSAADIGDGGPADRALLNSPSAVVLDGAGNVFVSTASNLVRKISAIPSAIAPGPNSTFSQAQISNIGNQALTLSGIAVSPGYREVLSLLPVDCSVSNVLTAGGSCYIELVSNVPNQNGVLTVSDDSFNLSSSQQTAMLGPLSSSPEASLSANGISFGIGAVGGSSSRTFTLSNTGGAPLTFSGISITGANAADFALTSNCGAFIAPGLTCTVTVSFTPGTEGSKTAAIVITDNAANSPQNVVLTGTALIPRWNINIEAPGLTTTTVQGALSVSGWAVFNISAITGIAIAVDGVQVGNATYGISRTDICAVYTNSPGCPNVGWSYTLDTTLLSNGTHSLQAIAAASTGQHSVGTSQFVVANWTTSSPFRISIDIPGPQSTSYSGSVVFGGWAINDNAAISSVVVSVDGVPYSNASYGALRSDVCAVYSGRAGCPNVGWNVPVNTTGFADGTHTFGVTATSASGQHFTTTKPFTVSNAAGNPIHASIDFPNAQSGPLSGTVGIGGWAIADNSQVFFVTVAVDGVSAGVALYGGARADVCQVYPGHVPCPNVGWNFALNTTFYSNGQHTLTLTAYGSRISTISTPFTINNSGSSGPIHVNIDTPNSISGPYLGLATFTGWAISDSTPLLGVEYTVDGYRYGLASYGGSRPDVCNVFPGRARCPNVGWSFTLDTTRFSSGPHTLGIVGVSSSQITTTFATFTVANWVTTNPLTVSIDRPNSQTGPLSGMTSVGGWAIDSMSGISSVAVSVDGVLFGNAIYGGARNDVCAAYPGVPGCPNVGWNFGLDTTQLTDGGHTFEATATAANGEHYTVTAPITVANAGGNPIRISIDRPNVGSGPQTGVVAIGGWAIADNGTVTTIEVLVDGEVYGNATYGGLRPDVCQVFPGRNGCPGVGWNYALDTTPLANGNHTIEITAQSSTGQKATVGNTFAVAN